jgi:hypothetical protein
MIIRVGEDGGRDLSGSDFLGELAVDSEELRDGGADVLDAALEFCPPQRANNHGEFPRSLLDVAHKSERQDLIRNRIFLGAHVAYQSDGSTFEFRYNRYPLGEWAWNPALNKFQPSLD